MANTAYLHVAEMVPNKQFTQNLINGLPYLSTLFRS